MFMRRIIIDTSSIVFAFSNRVNIFAAAEKLDYKPIVSSGIIRELRGLASARSKTGAAARLALETIKAKRVENMESSKRVDDLLFELGTSMGIDVCTNDAGLKKRLRACGARALSVARNGVLR